MRQPTKSSLIFQIVAIITIIMMVVILLDLGYPTPPKTISQDWTITLTSPFADEYETWYYTGPKPTHIYTTTGSYLLDNNTQGQLETYTGIPKAPVGWYLYITDNTEDPTLKLTKN